MIQFFDLDFVDLGLSSSGPTLIMRSEDESGVGVFILVDGGSPVDGATLCSRLKGQYGSPAFVDHVVIRDPDGKRAPGLEAVCAEFGVGTIWMNRPWAHLELIRDRIPPEKATHSSESQFKAISPGLVEVEELAAFRRIPVRSAFEGDKVGHMTVVTPSVERYLEAVVDRLQCSSAGDLMNFEWKVGDGIILTLNKR